MRKFLLMICALSVFACAGNDGGGSSDDTPSQDGSISVQCVDVFNASGGTVCGEATAMDVVEEFRGEVSRSESIVVHVDFENTGPETIFVLMEVGFNTGCNPPYDPWIFAPEQEVDIPPGESFTENGATCGSLPLGDNTATLKIGGEIHTVVHFTTIE